MNDIDKKIEAIRVQQRNQQILLEAFIKALKVTADNVDSAVDILKSLVKLTDTIADKLEK